MILLPALLLSSALAAEPRVGAAGSAPTPTPSPSALAPRVHSRKLLLSTLLASLKDKDESIRAKAAEDIGRMKPPAVEAVDDLINSLKDKASIVRYRAAESLEKIGTPKGRKAVYKFRKKLGYDKRSW